MSSERLNDLKGILREQLELASIRLKVANASFTATITPIPNGIPAPDGVPYIQKAGAEYLAALAYLSDASARFNNFIAYGIVPVEFLDKDEP